MKRLTGRASPILKDGGRGGLLKRRVQGFGRGFQAHAHSVPTYACPCVRMYECHVGRWVGR